MIGVCSKKCLISIDGREEGFGNSSQDIEL
jgi:hypothetical protein